MNPQGETITVTVERAKPNQVWVHRKEDSSWTILKTDLGKCLGVVKFEPQEHDQLKLAGGRWQVNDFDGRKEFHFKSARLVVAEDPRELLTLASKWTKGVGESMEADIWAAYGEDWRDHPELEEISRVTDAIRFDWGETLKRMSHSEEQAEAISFLMGKGCSITMADAAWEAWQAETYPKVSGDCYVLAELPHFGFIAVDLVIRKSFGIGDKDPRRVDAAVLYVLKQRLSEGSTVQTWQDVFAQVCELVAVDDNCFGETITRLVDRGRVRVMADMLGLATYLSLSSSYKDALLIWEKMIGMTE